MAITSPVSPRFGAFICHDQRRDVETGVRNFKFELTNDVSQYPLGWVVCPESGIPGNNDPIVAQMANRLPEIAQMTPEDRLALMRTMIRNDSMKWQIGKNKPEDYAGERLADRGQYLLQQCTADIVQKPNGSLSLIMDYDLDLRGGKLRAIVAQETPAMYQQRLMYEQQVYNNFMAQQRQQGNPGFQRLA